MSFLTLSSFFNLKELLPNLLISMLSDRQKAILELEKQSMQQKSVTQMDAPSIIFLKKVIEGTQSVRSPPELRHLNTFVLSQKVPRNAAQLSSSIDGKEQLSDGAYVITNNGTVNNTPPLIVKSAKKTCKDKMFSCRFWFMRNRKICREQRSFMTLRCPYTCRICR